MILKLRGITKDEVGEILVNIYLFKVKNRNSRKGSEICSKLPTKHPKDVNDIVLESLLLTLNKFYTFFK